jgi:hypothetical protein
LPKCERGHQDELAAEFQAGIAHDLGHRHAGVRLAHMVGEDVQRLADELNGDRRGEAPRRVEAEHYRRAAVRGNLRSDVLHGGEVREDRPASIRSSG